MIWAQQGSGGVLWLRTYLADGGLLSHKLLGRLRDSVRISALVPDEFNGRVDDFNVGGRHLDRRAVLDVVRRMVVDHLGSGPSASVVVEDRWAKREYPCGETSLPWVAIQSGDHEELYWVCDRRWLSLGVDAVLGAATGRRFLAVLSTWAEDPPDVCTTQAESFLANVSSRARALITEIFDGESYLVADL